MRRLTLRNTLLRNWFQKSDSGSMTVLFAEMLPILICALALSVDYGNSAMVQSEMQRAADAAGVTTTTDAIESEWARGARSRRQFQKATGRVVAVRRGAFWTSRAQ